MHCLMATLLGEPLNMEVCEYVLVIILASDHYFEKRLKLFPSSVYRSVLLHVTCSALNLFQERCSCICRPWSICYGMKMCLDL